MQNKKLPEGLCIYQTSIKIYTPNTTIESANKTLILKVIYL